jgi:predicted dehydrogenase
MGRGGTMTSATPQPVRAALLGTGAWAHVLAQAARGSRLEIVRCFSPTPERREAFAAATGIRAADDLDRVWDDDGIEAVVIAAPNDRHRALATQAAACGKHVFVEKPIAHTLEDGLAMAALESAHGIVLAVGHCARMLAGNRWIARAIAAGELGRVSHLQATFSNDRGLRLTRGDWRFYSASAPGGPLSQIGIHQFDTLRALGGDLAAVSAQSARLSPVGAEVEDQWVVSIRFADGKLGSIVTSWTSPGEYRVQATGDRASVDYAVDQSLWAQPARLHEHAVLERQARGDGPAARTRVPVPPGNMFRDELEQFAEAVRGDRSCELSATNGCQALAAVEAAIVSASRGGAAVTLDEMLAAATVRAAQLRNDAHRASAVAGG